MSEGRIIKYVGDRGFGFIRSVSYGEVFFHRRQCQPEHRIEPGDWVAFEVRQSDKGYSAANVLLLTSSLA